MRARKIEIENTPYLETEQFSDNVSKFFLDQHEIFDRLMYKMLIFFSFTYGMKKKVKPLYKDAYANITLLVPTYIVYFEINIDRPEFQEKLYGIAEFWSTAGDGKLGILSSEKREFRKKPVGISEFV